MRSLRLAYQLARCVWTVRLAALLIPANSTQTSPLLGWQDIPCQRVIQSAACLLCATQTGDGGRLMYLALSWSLIPGVADANQTHLLIALRILVCIAELLWHCRGDGLETGYRACLWLRSAIRVLVLLAEGKIDVTQPSGNVLYDWTR